MTNTIDVQLVIDNVYDDGTIRTDVQTKVAEPPYPLIADFDSSTDEFCDWEQEEIFPHTGTDNPDGGDAGYFVTVKTSSRPDLIPVGTEFEFC